MKNNFLIKAKPVLCLLSFVFLYNLAIENAFSRSLNSGNSRAFFKTNVEANVLGNFDNDEYQIFSLVNNERSKKRLPNLDWDDDLARLARRFSQQMARQNFFSHHDGEGKSLADRINSAKIKGWSKIGENLFYCEGVNNFDTLAVKGWMKSPGHRQNILDNSWTSTGIGIAESRDGRIYITQVFINR